MSGNGAQMDLTVADTSQARKRLNIILTEVSKGEVTLI